MDFNYMYGLDEAGRGPLAGPVTAGAVILPNNFPVEILNDSKKMSEKKRSAAEIVLKEQALWGIGLVGHKEIDQINILQASLYAMKCAFEMLLEKLPEWEKKTGIQIDKKKIMCMVDGTFCPSVSFPCVCEPKADAHYPAVMAASIIAKTERDRIMIQYDKIYPAYGYAKHKGYPTAEHRRICHELGPSPIQRCSFKY